MEIRPVPESEIESVIYLSSQAFANGRREIYAPDPDRHPRDIYGVYDAHGLQAKVAVMDYRIHMGSGAIIPMGGIGGVACLPASRGKGYIGACLDYTLERMRESGYLVSILYPFAWDFYNRYGWEWTGYRYEYTVPSRILMADPATESVRAGGTADTAAIKSIYTRYSDRYRGMMQRTDHLWQDILDDSKDRYTYTYLYEGDGEPEGYLTFRGGSRDQTHLREFIALTARARRGLLGLLRRHDMQIEKFVWSAPSDDSLWFTRTHDDIATRIAPAGQSRIVDVVGALQGWRPAPEAKGKVTLSVRDEHAPWNQGVWSVEFGEGTVQATASTATPQITLDIQALTQAYFGTPYLDEIRQAERMEVGDEAGYRSLRDLLAGPPMTINDFF